MKYGSVCSGIEAASVAWHPLGWEPVFFAEIEKFPCAVLAHHYPQVPNLGDITGFKEWPDAAIDVLVGGTPCQSFSVAGLRKGLADPRGNLCLTFLAIADKYRPKWLLWENVPGVLSSDGGRDFGAFLGGLGQLGYGWSYRVLDAQYVRVDGFGRAVPQRRRRVFVVGHLGDWRRAAAVLFERESLYGNNPPSRQAGQRVAPTISARPTGGGGLGTDFDCDGGLIAAAVAPTLNAHFGDKQGLEDQHVNGGMGLFVAHAAKTILSKNHQFDPETETFVTYATDGQSNAAFSNDIALTLASTNEAPYVAHTLRAKYDAGEDGTERGTPLVPINFQTRGSNIDVEQGLAATIGSNADRASGSAPCIAFDSKSSGRSGFGVGEISPTLRSMNHDGSHQNGGGQVAVAQGWAVRRLTPRECERLQGFPDGYTAVPVRGRPAADGPRYKALGNSMAVNVMRWIGRRIEMVAAL